MFHFRSKFLKYQNHPKPAQCQFCDLSQLETIVERNKHSLVIANRTFYDVWESRNVVDHLMVIPTRHVHILSELRNDERLAVMKLICKYEEQGYNVYARGANSPQRSVHHQHTHLIRTGSKQARLLLYLRRPYLLIKF